MLQTEAMGLGACCSVNYALFLEKDNIFSFTVKELVQTNSVDVFVVKKTFKEGRVHKQRKLSGNFLASRVPTNEKSAMVKTSRRNKINVNFSD